MKNECTYAVWSVILVIFGCAIDAAHGGQIGRANRIGSAQHTARAADLGGHTTQDRASPRLEAASSRQSGSVAAVSTRRSFMALWDRVDGASGYRVDVSASPSFESFVPGYRDLDVG